MTTITHRGRTLSLLDGETVLDCLERHGFERPSSCRTGVCQSCMMKTEHGAPPERAQQGLKPSLREAGCFLPCICIPTADLAVTDCGSVGSYAGRIVEVQPCTDRVLQVRLAVEDGSTQPFTFEAGQFISLVRPADGLTRPYSIANLPGTGPLELHVAVRRQGRMSGWLRSATGEEVTVRGPSGDCYYQAGSPNQPLLLAGSGTGLAPLLGVVRAALHERHRAPIHLYHGSRTAQGFYMREALHRLAEEHSNLFVHDILLDPEGDGSEAPYGALEAALLDERGALAGHRIYLCGNPALVQRLKKRAFLAGASLQEIHSDPFVTAAPYD